MHAHTHTRARAHTHTHARTHTHTHAHTRTHTHTQNDMALLVSQEPTLPAAAPQPHVAPVEAPTGGGGAAEGCCQPKVNI